MKEALELVAIACERSWVSDADFSVSHDNSGDLCGAGVFWLSGRLVTGSSRRWLGFVDVYGSVGGTRLWFVANGLRQVD